MRNFIDILNATNTPTAKKQSGVSVLKQLNEATLLEGKQYLDMFKWVEDISRKYKQDHSLEVIQKAKTLCRDLSRIDRQMWAARICRLYIVQNMAGWDVGTFARNTDSDFFAANTPEETEREKLFGQFQAEVAPMFAKYVAEYQKIAGRPYENETRNDPINYIRRYWINHYAGIEYSKIKEYRFDQTKTMHETFEELDALEEEYKEKITGLITMEEGDTFLIKLDNGFSWQLLNRGYCPKEADAMGHCGNAGARSGDRIISLRKFNETVDGVNYFNACLTFILNHDGFLGEMKGRANEKPAERYHPMIIALLLNPIIKGIRGGGYMPGNNFALSDLSEEQREALVEQKPELGGFVIRYKKLGDSEALRKSMAEGMPFRPGYWEDDLLVAKKWDNIEDFVDDLGNETAKWISKDDSFDHWDFESGDRDSIKSFYDALPLQYQIKIAEHAKSLVEENEDEDAVEDFDMSSTTEVIDKIEEYAEDTLYDPMGWAISDGMRSGAEGEAHKALTDAIDTALGTLRKGRIQVETYTRANGSTGFSWDSPVKIVFTIEEACEFLDSLGDMDEFEENYGSGDESFLIMYWDDEDKPIDVSEPSYGFSDYDEESAIESFFNRDEYGDLFDDIEKTPEMPDFATQDDTALKKWISDMYDKIPDGFIRKVHVEALDRDRLADVAKGLWKNYYGKQ